MTCSPVGSQLSQVHHHTHVIMQTLKEGNIDKGVPGTGQLEALWLTVVEGDLFASSHERKFLGFQLFTLLLPFLG